MSRNAVTNNSDDAPAPVGDRNVAPVSDAPQPHVSVPINQNFNDIVAQSRPRELTQSVDDPLYHDRLSPNPIKSPDKIDGKPGSVAEDKKPGAVEDKKPGAVEDRKPGAAEDKKPGVVEAKKPEAGDEKAHRPGSSNRESTEAPRVPAAKPEPAGKLEPAGKPEPAGKAEPAPKPTKAEPVVPGAGRETAPAPFSSDLNNQSRRSGNSAPAPGDHSAEPTPARRNGTPVPAQGEHLVEPTPARKNGNPASAQGDAPVETTPVRKNGAPTPAQGETPVEPAPTRRGASGVPVVEKAEPVVPGAAGSKPEVPAGTRHGQTPGPQGEAPVDPAPTRRGGSGAPAVEKAEPVVPGAAGPKPEAPSGMPRHGQEPGAGGFVNRGERTPERNGERGPERGGERGPERTERGTTRGGVTVTGDGGTTTQPGSGGVTIAKDGPTPRDGSPTPGGQHGRTNGEPVVPGQGREPGREPGTSGQGREPGREPGTPVQGREPGREPGTPVQGRETGREPGTPVQGREPGREPGTSGPGKDPVVPGQGREPGREPGGFGHGREPGREQGTSAPTKEPVVPGQGRESGREPGGLGQGREIGREPQTGRELPAHGGREMPREGREPQVAPRDGKNDAQPVNGRDGQPINRDGQPAQRDALPVTRDAQPVSRDGQLAGRDGQLGRDGQTIGRDGQPSVREGQLVARDGQVAGREGQPVGREAQPVGRDGQPVGREGQPVGRDGQVAGQNGGQAVTAPGARDAQNGSVLDGAALRDGKPGTPDANASAVRDSQAAAIRDGQCATNRDAQVAATRDGQLAASREGQVATNREGQVATNREGQVATNREGQVATSREGQVATNREGQLATNREGQVATNREGQVASNRDGQVATNRDGQVATNRDAQVATNRDVQVATNREGQVATNRDVQVATNRDVSTTQSPTTGRDGQPIVIADPTARSTSTTNTTESGVRVPTTGRIEGTVPTEATKTPTQASSNNEVVTNNPIIIPKDRTTSGDSKSGEANLDTSNTGTNQNGIRVNPILVNGSNDPNSANNNQNGAQPTIPGINGTAQVDPSQIQITLPGVQIVIDPNNGQVIVVPGTKTTTEPTSNSTPVEPPHVHPTHNGVEIQTTNGNWTYIAGGSVMQDGTVVSPAGSVWVPTTSGEYVQVQTPSQQIPNDTTPDTPSSSPVYYQPSDFVTYYVPTSFDEPIYTSTPFGSFISSVANDIIDLVAPAVNISLTPATEPVTPSMGNSIVNQIPFANEIISEVTNQPLVQTIFNTIDTVQNIVNIASPDQSSNTFTQPTNTTSNTVEQISQAIETVQQVADVISTFEQIINDAIPTSSTSAPNLTTAETPFADSFNFGQQPSSNFGQQIDPSSFVLQATENESFIQNQPFFQGFIQQDIQPAQPEVAMQLPETELHPVDVATTEIGPQQPSSITGSQPILQGQAEESINLQDQYVNQNQRSEQTEQLEQTDRTKENNQKDPYVGEPTVAQKDPYIGSNDGRVEASFISSDNQQHTWDSWDTNRSEMPYDREADDKQRIAKERAEQEQKRAEDEAREARERAEAMRRQIEDQERRLRELMLAEMATKKAQQVLGTNEPRRRYVVKAGDSLETIAEEQLKDANLAALIFQVNKLTIRTHIVNGNRVPQLKIGMTIVLPNTQDIAVFRAAFSRTQAAVREARNHSAEVSKKGMRALLAR